MMKSQQEIMFYAESMRKHTCNKFQAPEYMVMRYWTDFKKTR